MRFNHRLGDHLRRVRRQKGLSLLDVEAASNKEFKASVVGAYERGERAISVNRLARLAELYRVPLPAMLPSDGRAASPAPEGVVIDVGRLARAGGTEAKAIGRFVRSLQSERGDWSGKVLTIRGDDLRALACVLELGVPDLLRKLEELGVRAS